MRTFAQISIEERIEDIENSIETFQRVETEDMLKLRNAQRKNFLLDQERVRFIRALSLIDKILLDLFYLASNKISSKISRKDSRDPIFDKNEEKLSEPKDDAF